MRMIASNEVGVVVEGLPAAAQSGGDLTAGDARQCAEETVVPLRRNVAGDQIADNR